MKDEQKKRQTENRAGWLVLALSIFLAALAWIALEAVPPLSLLRGWFAEQDMLLLWRGLAAGTCAGIGILCKNVLCKKEPT